MNTLFIFASAIDTNTDSQHSRLMEFYKLDKEIAKLEDKIFTDWLNDKMVTVFNKHTMSKPKQVKQWPPSQDLGLSLMRVRAKRLLRSLNIIN